MFGCRRLLHILIYFKGASFPSVSNESLSRISWWVLTIETPSEESYLSLNGNRIPTCYFLWEDFLGCWSCRVHESQACSKMQEFRMRSLRGWLLCIVFQKKIDPFFDSYPPRYENNIWLPLPCCFEFQFNSVMIIMMMRVTKVEYKEDWTIDCKDRRGKIWKRNGACYN